MASRRPLVVFWPIGCANATVNIKSQQFNASENRLLDWMGLLMDAIVPAAENCKAVQEAAQRLDFIPKQRTKRAEMQENGVRNSMRLLQGQRITQSPQPSLALSNQRLGRYQKRPGPTSRVPEDRLAARQCGDQSGAAANGQLQETKLTYAEPEKVIGLAACPEKLSSALLEPGKAAWLADNIHGNVHLYGRATGLGRETPQGKE
ncbi:hypothetical protein JX265_012666 [Neoarthrinium moseri]|uniref:Uncharacterized protein n=1 Tax=Neoarthrinium moseri TaxID=1658444 RepID=A0A9P9W9T4_9PEZI|nr:hypothetical protein JX266_011276 [Neoarthrinium moseri]KAI1853835.1 hypothetical protein JX265_012666 [Neoarthrinium moseri]